MTAHRPKPTITPERVDWFARYHAKELAWGVFHVWLDDGNYGLPFELHDQDQPAEVIEAAQWFARLTPSQRKRLGRKAEVRMYELGLVRRPPRGPFEPMVVTAVDAERGVITCEAKR